MRQQDMAEYLQCTQVCYSYYESGKRDIPTDVLIRIARYYNVSVDYLLGLTDRREAYPARKRLSQLLCGVVGKKQGAES